MSKTKTNKQNQQQTSLLLQRCEQRDERLQFPAVVLQQAFVRKIPL
jgi:hypothetical protein